MSQKQIGFGIIGCRMGLQHAQGLRNCKGGVLKAICDTNAGILQAAKLGTGLPDADCYDDYRELLKRPDIDAVIIATPDQIHSEQTAAAFAEGKHVLCEKPMALTVEECKSMIRTASEAGRKLMIGQICRYTPGFKAAKMLIERGEIGELFFVESEYAHDYAEISGVDNWRLDPVRLRHPVLGGGCHPVDLLRWIAGDPYEVCAFANKKVLKHWPVDDCTIAIMRFPREVMGKVFVSAGCKREYTMRSVFYGDQGTIITDNTSDFLMIYKNHVLEPGVFPEVKDEVLALKYPVNINNHNTTDEIAEFIDCIQKDKEVVTDGVQGASTVAACLAIVESASKCGEKVKIEYRF